METNLPTPQKKKKKKLASFLRAEPKHWGKKFFTVTKKKKNAVWPPEKCVLLQ